MIGRTQYMGTFHPVEQEYKDQPILNIYLRDDYWTCTSGLLHRSIMFPKTLLFNELEFSIYCIIMRTMPDRYYVYVKSFDTGSWYWIYEQRVLCIENEKEMFQQAYGAIQIGTHAIQLSYRKRHLKIPPYNKCI